MKPREQGVTIYLLGLIVVDVSLFFGWGLVAGLLFAGVAIVFNGLLITLGNLDE